MRFLYRDSTGKYSLTRDLVGDDPFPLYAILSHTWGPDNEEVTFEDMKNGTGKENISYRKIQFCGYQAQLDNLQHFWVETCCTIPTYPDHNALRKGWHMPPNMAAGCT
jgi:hypothetical protein